jgi:hypothetical protein
MKTVHSSLADIALLLYARWQDERGYEDFIDYIEHMKSKLPDGAVLNKMTKRPFRIEYTMADGARRWISVTSTETKWGGYAPRVNAEA